MVKICHITSVHRFDDIRIFRKECVSLANHGFDVTLIAFNAIEGIVNNVKIINAGPSFKNRMQRMQKGGAVIGKFAIEQDAHIYHFHDPELIPLGKKLARLGKIVIYDIHEDVPRQILTKPYFSKFVGRLVSFFMERYENKAVRNFDALLCATPHIQKRFERIHCNVFNINNYPLESEISQNIPENVKKENKVCYIGGITEIRGILQLIDAMAFCGGIKLDLAGDFPEGKFRQKAELSAGWAYVNILGVVDRKTALKIKSESIAGIIPFLSAGNHINAQPNKIFEYMASALPVIGSNFPLWQEIILNNECGLCVDSCSAAEIAKAICSIASNPEMAVKMGENGLKAVKEIYNWKTEESKLLEIYLSLTNNRNNVR